MRKAARVVITRLLIVLALVAMAQAFDSVAAPHPAFAVDEGDCPSASAGLLPAAVGGGGASTTSTTTSTTRHTTETQVIQTFETYSTKVTANNRGQNIYEETVAGAPGSAAVLAADQRARNALTAAGVTRIIGPSVVLSNRTIASRTGPVIQFNHAQTSVTTTTTFGPATILIGSDQEFTCFIPAGTTNVNVNTHTETFNDAVYTDTYLNFEHHQFTAQSRLSNAIRYPNLPTNLFQTSRP